MRRCRGCRAGARGDYLTRHADRMLRGPRVQLHYATPLYIVEAENIFVVGDDHIAVVADRLAGQLLRRRLHNGVFFVPASAEQEGG